MEKLVINFTPTGMMPTKDMTPHVPISPEEIIENVRTALKYGVSMVHLHARDRNGLPAYNKEIYAQIIEGIRSFSSDLVICVSTSGRTHNEFEKRSEVLELKGNLKPDMASLTLSSLNFNNIASINSPEIIKKLAQKMKAKGIKPELEAFDIGMINYANYLIKKGLLAPPYYFNLILGNIACAQADPLDLGLMIYKLPEESYWSVGGIGNSQLPMNVAGICHGGGVRIGLEDNIYFDNERTVLATNEMLLKRIKNIAESYGAKIASPKEVREHLNIS